MLTVKRVVGAIAALLPVLYCGGLLYYFLDGTGGVREADEIGLGRTVLGLAVLAVLFAIPFILKFVWIFIGPRSPGSGGRGGSGDGEFDADAVLARYTARRPAEASSDSPATPPAAEDSGPASTGFGRRIR